MIKRIVDISISLILLVVLSPLLYAVICVLWLCEGRPIFFRQDRPGLHGKMFSIYKFRTMIPMESDVIVNPEDVQRITKIGQRLRQTSIDELPELYNVLKGDMSLVGPRPLLEEYLPLYSKEHARRHEVKPGITGWAQINGRNSISWEDKFKLDVWYVGNNCLWLDVKILFITIWKVVLKRGISHSQHATMPRFKGS